MQSVTSEKVLGYNLVSRAIYYGASLLRDTVPAGDTKYTNIHKVYTVWFCAKQLSLKEYPETKGKYIHRYGFRRFYDDIDKATKPEKFADLIEVVLIELPKLKRNDNETAEMIFQLFNNTSDLISTIETKERVNLAKIRKGVADMIDYEARAEQREKIAFGEGKQEGKQEGMLELAKNYIDSLIDNNKGADYNSIIKKATVTLKLDAQIVQELRSTYIK